jgi:hypothetical protein
MNKGYIYNSTPCGYDHPDTHTIPSWIPAAYTHTNPTAHIHPTPPADSLIYKGAQRWTVNLYWRNSNNDLLNTDTPNIYDHHMPHQRANTSYSDTRNLRNTDTARFRKYNQSLKPELSASPA